MNVRDTPAPLRSLSPSISLRGPAAPRSQAPALNKHASRAGSLAVCRQQHRLGRTRPQNPHSSPRQANPQGLGGITATLGPCPAEPPLQTHTQTPPHMSPRGMQGRHQAQGQQGALPPENQQVLPLARFPGDRCGPALVCLSLSGRHSSQGGSGCGGYATKNTARPRKAAETPRANPPTSCLLLEGQGTQGSTGPPGTKGLTRGPEKPERCSTKTSSRQAQPTGRGVGSRPQSIPLSCARSGESWRQGSSRAAGSLRDTLIATNLWVGGLVWSQSQASYTAPPGRRLPELPSQGPPLLGPP